MRYKFRYQTWNYESYVKAEVYNIYIYISKCSVCDCWLDMLEPKQRRLVEASLKFRILHTFGEFIEDFLDKRNSFVELVFSIFFEAENIPGHWVYLAGSKCSAATRFPSTRWLCRRKRRIDRHRQRKLSRNPPVFRIRSWESTAGWRQVARWCSPEPGNQKYDCW